MARIKYYLRSKSNPSKVYVRFSISRDVNFRKITPLLVNPENFNKTTGTLKINCKSNEDFKFKEELESLTKRIISKFNDDKVDNKTIDKFWFDDLVDNHFNPNCLTNSNFELRNFAQKYIDELPNRANPNGSLGCAKSTLVKYRTILKKIIEFEESRNRKTKISDVDLKFRDEFVNYLLQEQNLGKNTTGRYLVFVKTVCLFARRSGVKVNYQLELIKGFSIKVEKITLSFEELELITKTRFEDEKLDSAKDWLLLGCYLGQRVSDLLRLTKKNIISKGNMKFVELIQQKTNKKVTVLLHPKVIEILKKRDFSFPYLYSQNIGSASSTFNKLIKIVAEKSGLTNDTLGAKVNPKTNRKESGSFPKYELITSHICRRSFATNFYGDIPTPLLINITGHSTEKEFLNYIGKASIDYAEQLAKYWKIGM